MYILLLYIPLYGLSLAYPHAWMGKNYSLRFAINGKYSNHHQQRIFFCGLSKIVHIMGSPEFQWVILMFPITMVIWRTYHFFRQTHTLS
jgi:hypothetical protein